MNNMLSMALLDHEYYFEWITPVLVILQPRWHPARGTVKIELLGLCIYICSIGHFRVPWHVGTPCVLYSPSVPREYPESKCQLYFAKSISNGWLLACYIKLFFTVVSVLWKPSIEYPEETIMFGSCGLFEVASPCKDDSKIRRELIN